MDIRKAVDAYFHREELEDRASKDADDDQEMSTNTKATMMVRRLKVNDPLAMASLQGAMCDTFTPATAPRRKNQRSIIMTPMTLSSTWMKSTQG